MKLLSTEESAKYLEVMCTEYSSRKNRPTVHVFCRNQGGGRVEKTFSYRPYFFLRKLDINEQRLREIKSVLRVKEGYTGLKGENLCKLTLNLPLNVGLARDFLHSKGIKSWEADVYAFSLRWLIDKKLFYLYPYYPLEYPAELVLESRKVVLYLDIEKVGSQVILISFAKGFEAPITYSSKTFGLTQPNTLCFSNETQMLSAFLKAFREIDPDIVVGWNIHFDLREITKRMNQLHLPYRSLSPMNQISFSRASKKPSPSKHLSKQRKKQIGEPEVIIKGREAFDLAKAYKELFKKELRIPFPEALNVVCKRHLGRGKLPLDISEMEEVWSERPNYFVEYNKNDVTLLQDLEKEIQILEFFDGLRKTAGVRLRDVWYKHRLIDSGLLRISDKRLISAKSLPVSEETYVGALREVEPGIYENMMMVDFRGFYASLVMKHNISPETLDPFGENIVDAKHRFKKEPKGLMPRLIERLVKKKDEAKIILKKAPSYRTKAYYNALKFLVASSYGQLGYPNSRVYSIPCAEGVTLPARKQIGILRDLLNGLGHRVAFLDSVLPDTPVTIKREGEVKILPIEDLAPWHEKTFLRCPIKDTKILTEEGFVLAKYLYRHKVKKKGYRILTRKGYVEVTEDHSLVINGEKVSPKVLKVGDKIELIDYPKLGEREVDKELSWLLGFYLAEGSCGTYKTKEGGVRHSWHIDNQKIELLKKCKSIIKRKLGLDTKIIDIRKSSSTFRLIGKGKLKLLTELFSHWCNTKGGDKKVPSFILNGNHKKDFIKGLWDGDGNIHRRTKVHQVNLNDKCLLSGLCCMLQSLGKEYSLFTRKDKPNSILLNIIRKKRDPKLKEKDEIKKINPFMISGVACDIETDNHHFSGGLGNVLLHNTDGCAFPFDSSKKAREEFLSFLNSKFEGLELDEADYFKCLIVVAKTRYVGLNEQDEIITKGMSLIRSDVPIYFAEAQEHLTKLVLKKRSRQEILDYCKKIVEEMPKQKLADLAVPKGLKMSLDSYAVKAYHVTASKRAAKELGIKFKIGDKPRILPTRDSQKYIAIRADTVSIGTIKVNYPKLVSLLLGVLRPVYRLLDIDDDEVRGKSIQTKLI